MRSTIYVVLITFLSSSFAMAEEDYLDSLMEMSIEELMNVTITSVSKKKENIFKAPSSIFVLTSDEIRRAGATSIPEALRMVPGIQVARSDSASWAITSRGFNGQFANKLLVLVDGRTVYTPLYSGVYWDTIDYVLEDIDRIEVIKGPGATLWGSNAVNGVINIITKSADKTQGHYANLIAGNHDLGNVSYRYGGKTENGHYRAYGKFTARDNSEYYGEEINDDWMMGRGGFRVDTELSEKNKLTVQGDLYHGGIEKDLILPELTPPYFSLNQTTEKITGANIIAEINKELSPQSKLKIQSYLDYTRRDLDALDQKILTADIEMQHSWEKLDNHEIVWGGGARLIYDDLEGTKYVSFEPESDTRMQFNAFVQDKIKLSDKLFLTLGSKIEWNEYTDFEIQPSAKLAYDINENNFLWVSVSRAVRTPNRSTMDLEGLALQGLPALPPPAPAVGPVYVTLVGEDEYEIVSEDLIAYELGYRSRLKENLFFDISLFYNDYSELANFVPGTPVDMGTYWILPTQWNHNDEGYTYGSELSVKWDVNDNWKLAAYYTYLDVELDYGITLVNTQSKTPEHQVNLHSHLNISDNWELDNILYYVDKIQDPRTGQVIDEYIRFDTRIAYKPNENVEISIVGQNLFDDWHQEFFPFQYQQPAEVGRAVYGSVTLKF